MLAVPREPLISDLPASTLSWSDWPATRRPGQSIGAGAIILATMGAIAGWDPWLAVLGGVALVLATSEVLLPTRYAVTPEGITITQAFRRLTEPWSRFSAVRAIPGGLVLEGRGSRPALRRHRTRRLRCPEQRDAVQQLVQRHLEHQCAS